MTYFCLYKMSIDAIIMNRVLPSHITDAYFEDWRKSQAKYLTRAEEYFSPIPVFPVDLFRGEVLGYDRLRDLSDQIYGKEDPLQRFFTGEPYDLVKDEGVYCLSMKLPFIAKRDVELNKVSNELIIRIGGFKRHILLPRQVAASKSVNAKLEGEQLCIYFQGGNHEQEEE